MSKVLFDEIPSLDLHDFQSNDKSKRQAFVQKLGEAYHNIGFVAVRNHGLSDTLVENLYHTFQQFFALPDEVKQRYDVPGLFGQRGYTGKGKEHAKGRNTGDLKEFYHVGQFVEDDDPVKATYPDNIWPKEIPGMEIPSMEIPGMEIPSMEIPSMEVVAKEAYQTLERAGRQMLRAIALYLALDEDYFEAKVHHGNSILRAIHYYPIENPEAIPEDAVRAAEHGDINLITLLMGASAEGLQVLRRDGKWIPITALPDQIVVNVGDMLARLTNDKLKSTIHRVVNPPKEKMGNSRYSIPFFMHPRADMKLACLNSCINKEHPKQYTDMTAGGFLEERLAEIGLKK